VKRWYGLRVHRATLAFGVTLALAVGHGGADTTPPGSELIPTYVRTELDNGITLLLLEHHELPLVDFEFVFRAGSISDPAGREGLADISMELLRKGTRTRSAGQLAEELDFLGGVLGPTCYCTRPSPKTSCASSSTCASIRFAKRRTTRAA
jgi:hypothetical protein